MHAGKYNVAVVIAVLSLAGCSGPSTSPAGDAKSEPEKKEAPPAPVTAHKAFWEIYKSSYKWAPDSLPLSIEAKEVAGFTYEGGTAAAWEANFGSLSRKEAHKFTYSIMAKPPDLIKGVSVGSAIPWGGPVKKALTFRTDDFKVDSDAAYKTALEKAQSWLKDHPKTDITTFSLGADSRFPGPVWFIKWGTDKAGFFVIIDATTGKMLGK